MDDVTALAASSGAKLGPKHRKVTAIKVFSQGFVCACGPDKVFIFLKSEDIHQYYVQVSFTLTKTFNISNEINDENNIDI